MTKRTRVKLYNFYKLYKFVGFV